MATTRELALEASVRFTDRNKYSVKQMLGHAKEIEDWLNRDLPKLKFVDNNGAVAEPDKAWEAIEGKMRSVEQKEEE